jgi:cyclic dehypoxanthinyl futalosine synthase
MKGPLVKMAEPEARSALLSLVREKVEADQRLDRDLALEAWSLPLLALGRLADQRRQLKVPGRKVTYLVDRNINFTNRCEIGCQFCAFWRPSSGVGEREGRHEEDGYVLSRSELSQKLAELSAVGGTRVLIQGGVNPDLDLGWHEELFRFMKEAFGEIQIDGLSPTEILSLARREGLSTREVLSRLQAAGLDGMPGGGAEVLVDEVRQRVSPRKVMAGDWLEIMGEAHGLGLTTSATQVIGVGETIEQRLEHLLALRELQDRSVSDHGRGFVAFIPWTMVHQETPLGKAARQEPAGYIIGGPEYLKHLAWSRLVLDNFTHLGASWPTQGPDVAEFGLTFGAGDLGSTLMEENVVTAAGTTHPCLTEPDLRWYITSAGFEPVKRDSSYSHLE